jgi:hypothetical protein
MRSLDPTGRGRAALEQPLEAPTERFAITFEGRFEIND